MKGKERVIEMFDKIMSKILLNRKNTKIIFTEIKKSSTARRMTIMKIILGNIRS